ncbi:plasmid partitioning protein RepB [Rhizobium sp. TRM95796]|uniref:plasmid partitioning protein RepB n=1 Tax=Rhizobium sp. TRM95796 TaxID=2979862 RepID=UPI0021E81D00|nr:plasmid partitioning protein RepB [Rhizobium sp. TRM95796]MCV3769021.1 plasmid partitioning protein RepB [Rhizobium sp. TRM95796]
MSRRTTLSGIFQQSVEGLAAANFDEREEPRGHAGPVKSMALTLGRMEDEAKALQEALKSGHHVQDLDPASIDPSFVRDRLEDIEFSEDDPFVRSIAENGQEVPILVRPHPTEQGRYQVAYGHRRLKAAMVLGIKVKAVIREFDDQSLVIAQGIENGERKNLSYIERVAFALALEQRGFPRHVIMKALSTDKTELSKMLSVAANVPSELIRLVGSAPGIGRRKWLALSEALSPRTLATATARLGKAEAQALTSDERFELALASVTAKGGREAPAVQWSPKAGGDIAASIKTGRKTFVLSLKSTEAAAFGNYLSKRLDELFEDFAKTRGD